MSQRITCSFCASIAKPTETECPTCGAPLPIGVANSDPTVPSEPADSSAIEESTDYVR